MRPTTTLFQMQRYYNDPAQSTASARRRTAMAESGESGRGTGRQMEVGVGGASARAQARETILQQLQELEEELAAMDAH